MSVCLCSLAGTSACNFCPSNPNNHFLRNWRRYADFDFPRTFTVTYSSDDVDDEPIEEKISKITETLKHNNLKKELDELKKMQKDISERINDLEEKLQDKE